ncbi:nuclear factor related to kappa-B-binding protein isoform X2 [Belonocnema kinseyi]|uniref:nuclear factor related to kappa-B-binding protein isoform X2 n=1 Tax=Belonocnema kinseyi TaxID=2817044 RepID=UPI00143CF3D4|nr:nuclear factor related to kappa-B-binding protein isoform X2 [Belonocnema kinseyi]
MEVDECSANGDSGAEEDEDDDMSQGSGTNTSTSNSSDSSSSSDSGEDSDEEQGTNSSEANSSLEDEEDKNDDGSIQEEQEENEDRLRWETCVAAGGKVKLPQDLCEHPSIFRELFNYPRLWQESLSENQKETLYSLLPQFPKDCNAELELEKTVQMLFEGENDRFGVSPLDSFHKHLSAGHYRPDIKRMRNLVRKAQQRRALFEERKHAYELASQLLKSRESLLSNAYKQGFSQNSHRTLSKFHWRKPKPALVEEKTQLRYLEEMSALRAELGTSARLADDSTSENEENYPQFQLGNSKQKKKKRSIMTPQIPLIRGMQMCTEDDAIRPVFSTLQRSEYVPSLSFSLREQTEESYRTMLIAHKKRRTRRDNHPELNTQGIAFTDLMQRAQVGQKHKITATGPVRVPPSKKRIKLEQNPLSQPPVPKISSNAIKHESDNSDYSHTTDEIKHSSLLENEGKSPNFSNVKAEPLDLYEHRSQPKQKMTPVTPKNSKHHTMMISMSEVKREIEDMDYESDITVDHHSVKEEIRVEHEEEDEIDKKELDLDSIDMMQLPIQLDDGIDILSEVKCENEEIMITDGAVSVSGGEDLSLTEGGDLELMQETHTCFFSLLRDAFISKGEYRMNTAEMKEAVMLWQGNPISPLNDWYSLAPSWPSLVPLALGFLAGELTYPQDLDQQNDGEQELVPYLENKGRGVYAWIGAGRDSDSRLATLCTRFLLHRDSLGPPQPVTFAANSTKAPLPQPSVSTSNSINSTPTGMRSESPVSEVVGPDTGLMSSVAEWEPPRALYPTDWKVRPSTLEEREEFRRQERMRYAAPHKAFTYRMHGYSSVVGPVKGIYQHNVGSGLTKPRGHSLLVADRPNFVTILALVRDATARLPNGEGTRADICQLLKDSQYIRELDETDSNHDKEGNLHSVVSGALDRLHYEADPCVRYYPRRKEWLYLHRARSESEFEMYHQQFQGVPKNKKSSSGSSRNKSLQSSGKPASGKEQSHNQGTVTKETTPKKEKKSATQAPVITRKETRKVEDKIVLEQPTSIESPTIIASIPQMTTTPTISVATPPPIIPTSSISSISNSIMNRETSITIDTKPQIVTPSHIVKTAPTANVKPVAVVKTTTSQSLLQSNQQHFPHHQIQVSTSAGLQTIRLSGHSVLHSAQPVSTSVASSSGSTSPSVATIFPTAKIQNQHQQQQTVMTNQGAKSILQNANVKQQQQHVLPGKTLLSSQIKLVSSGQIKSLLTGHGLQGQTIFIKQSSVGAAQSQQLQQQQQLKQQQQQLQQRVVTASQQQLQNPGMQRIIAQIGGKPIAVQIQQSPQQQQNQQKILAKVLTSAGGGQLISVESLLAKQGLKLASTTGHATQINRQGKQVIQTQYQVVSQAQTSSVPPKIIVSTHQQQQQTGGQQQTVRMVTAQLAGKPIVLASGSKGVGVSGSGGVILGKQQSQQAQSSQQQPIILPSQLLNIKTLHGLKVIPTAAGLKTGAAVYARVLAPTTMSSTQTTTNQQQQQQSAQNQQPSRGNSYTP